MVEIIPKPIQRLPEWQKIIFYFSSALLIAVILGYVLLIYLGGKAANTQQDLEEQIAKVGTAEEKTLEKEIFADKKTINDFTALLNMHQKPSSFFTMLEGITHPKVWFSDVTLDVEGTRATLSGETPNFSTLDQQLLILQKEKSIKEIALSKLSLGEEGQTQFTLFLSLDPTIFK